jgi:glutamine amidotransferase
MVTIIDYGLGNLASIKNMVKKINGESVITSSLEEITAAQKLILPGVGHFARGMENLDKRGMIPVLNELVLHKKIPILGICLGMQLLTRHSEEGDTEGLGWINAKTKQFKFENSSDLKIPHMGWNDVSFTQKTDLTKDIIEVPRYYFVHSYYVECEQQENVLGTCNYGFDFHASIVKDNIAGFQFHPEKSHKFGMQLLKNYIDL